MTCAGASRTWHPLAPWRSCRESTFIKALEGGRFDRLLDVEERERWEQFVIRTANTPGRERVVLRLTFTDDDGSPWHLWAVYRLGPDTNTDTAQITLDTIHPDDNLGRRPADPDEIADEAIFEAGSACVGSTRSMRVASFSARGERSPSTDARSTSRSPRA